ncbi:hypothetical protein [Streptomyces ziwulingensis]|uniref:Uncharacterized protein n=1 Tax=Streptomyces ziwulingensis TaxID=1045501 RepID=A0ABP9D0E1_9ACTN
MAHATSPCATCGDEFVPAARRRGRPDSRFCTAACRALWERTHGSRISSAGPAEPVAADTVTVAATPLPPLGTEHSCPHCGHQLTIVNFVLPALDATGDLDTAGDEEVPSRYITG